METHPAILRARETLEALTPLTANCGALCGARCCQSGDNGEGMLLFPTEEYLYEGAAWARVTRLPQEGAALLVCDGTCPRAQRPLACRIFPLTPYLKDGRLRVRMDPRAQPMCPLYGSGMDGLDARFTAAVRAAMRPLASIDGQWAHLELLTQTIDDYLRWKGKLRNKE